MVGRSCACSKALVRALGLTVYRPVINRATRKVVKIRGSSVCFSLNAWIFFLLSCDISLQNVSVNRYISLWLSVFVYPLSLFLSVYVSVSLSLFFARSLALITPCLPVCLCLYLSVSVCLCLSVCRSLARSLALITSCLPVCLSRSYSVALILSLTKGF